MRLMLTLITLTWSLPLLAIELNGQTEFAQKLVLNSAISARVAEVHAVAGKRVARGDLLLRFEDTALRAGRDAAAAGVAALSPRLERARIELDKAQELFDRDSLALVELENAQREQRIAEANLDAARAKLARAEYRLAQADLRSPIDGVVLQVSTFPGHYINTRVSDPMLLTIADDRHMIAQALLPLERLEPGMLNRKARVSYRDKSFSGSIVGVGSEITPGANNHPAVRLQIRFRANGAVPAGLPVTIDIDDS